MAQKQKDRARCKITDLRTLDKHACCRVVIGRKRQEKTHSSCDISLWESTGVPWWDGAGVGVSHPPPISTAYRGIMSVTSVRLPDSFHIVRPRSPSVPLSIEVGLRQPSVSKRKCSFNASSFVGLHLSIRGGSLARRNVPDRSFRGVARPWRKRVFNGGSKGRNRVTPGNLFIGEAR